MAIRITIDISPDDIPLDTTEWKQFFENMTALSASVPLMSFQYTAQPDKSPMTCSFKVTAEDMRQWLEEIEYIDGVEAEPQISIEVQDFWRLSEAKRIMVIADDVIAITKKYSATMINILWSTEESA